MDQERIGKLIKELRKNNNLTQKDLADSLGVTYQAVSKWENGKNIPDISILKELSNNYNIDINDLLEGNNIKKKKNKLLLIIPIIVIIILIGVLLITINNNNFEFKTISSKCLDFKLSGSVAYNKDHSSLYISNIEFCGKENNEVYKKIECNLYETYNNTEVKISSCTKKENLSLKEYLKVTKINVNNYKTSCPNFKDSKLYLKIEATTTDNKKEDFNIPIKLEDNC